MFAFIPIPIGRKYTSSVTGSTLQPCVCEQCGKEYYYVVQRTAQSEKTSYLWLNNDGASASAQNEAQEGIEKILENAVDPVACPECGWYQAKMVRILKARKLLVLLLWIPIAFVIFFASLFGSSIVIYVSIGLGVIISFWGILFMVVTRPNRHHRGQGYRDVDKAFSSRGISKMGLEAREEINDANFTVKISEALQKSLCLIAAIDGKILDEEVILVQKIIKQVTNTDVSAIELRKIESNLDEEKAIVISLLSQLGYVIDIKGKEMFIKTCLMVAISDNNLDEKEIELLDIISLSLRMRPQQLQRLLRSF